MKRLFVKAKKNNAGSTWKKNMKYTDDMRDRGRDMLKMASNLRSWKSIVDVGCGNQQLKEVVADLNPRAKYVGVDRLDHRPDTLIADFNKGEYPNVKADLAVVSGVFEYIQPEMVDKFLDNVCNTAKVVAFSYWPTDYESKLVYKSSEVSKARPQIWVNQFKLAEIMGLFSRRGFQIEELKRYRTSSQYMMVFSKKG